MEMSIKTMMILVIGVIAVLMLLALFSSGQSQSAGMLDGLFSWFRGLGGGA